MPQRYVNYPRNGATKTQLLLETASYNNMDVDVRENTETIARYVKTVLHGVGFNIMNRETNKPDTGLLKTSVSEAWIPGQEIEFWYPDEVIELYKGDNVTLFERMNRKMFEEGVFIPYENDANYIWMPKQVGEGNRYEYFLSEVIEGY